MQEDKDLNRGAHAYYTYHEEEGHQNEDYQLLRRKVMEEINEDAQEEVRLEIYR